MNFYILNKEEELITTLNDGEVGNGVAYSAYVFEKLDSYDLLEMTIKADSEELSLIEEEYYIVFKDINGWKEYTIYEVEDEDGSNFETTIRAELSSSELIDEIVRENLSGVSKDPETILEALLKDTRWKVGNVDSSIYSSNFSVNTMNMNVLEAIKELSRSHSCEVRFSYQVDGNEVVSRFVDLYKRYGEDKGKRFEIDKDITSIKRNVNTETIKTAIIPYSNEQTETDEETGEETTHVIDIKDVEWSVAKGDPVDKPLGQDYIADPNAFELWGRLNKDGTKRHRFLPMEFNLDNANSIMNMAWVQLGRYTQPKATYEVEAVDLFAQSNGSKEYEHEKTALGDTVVAIDKYFAKPLMIETRVVEAERNLFDPRQNKYVFGSSRALFSVNETVEKVEDIAKDVDSFLQDINSVQSNLNGKNKVFRGSNQPQGMIENDIWFRPHPSMSGENQMLVYDGIKWEIHADTSELQDASRLQFGTIDAGEVNIINLTANNITGGNLELSKGLQITNSDTPVLSVDSSGEVEMNVSKMTINAKPVATKEDVDNIEIGGRNLIPSFNSSRWDIAQTAKVYDYELVFPEGTNPQARIVIDVEKNTNYTMTFNSDHARYYIYEMINGEQGKILRSITEGSDIFTFKTEDYNQITLLINSYSQRVDLTRNIWKPQLERGTKATDWTQAPEDVDAKIDEKASNDYVTEVTESIEDQLTQFVPIEGYEEEIGEINSALNSYLEMLEAGEISNQKAAEDISELLTRTDVITNNLGEFTESWNFLDTKITMGEEGLLVGEFEYDASDKPQLVNGILIGTERIDFYNDKKSIAHISGQLMQINHGIFVDTLRVGEHIIETIGDGHTIWQWYSGEDD